ncbi:hypothetical protein CXG46_09585 [Nocardioides alpinus]|nr:hypothetical protein CXG46_09585 [Nocardioides alpinus]
MSSTMFSVGTLLRRAEDTGTEVKLLVQNSWLTGRVLGCDGVGAILDDGEGSQSLVRLDQVAAVTFSRAEMEDGLTDTGARSHGAGSGPIEAGPITVPTQKSGEYHFLTAKPY